MYRYILLIFYLQSYRAENCLFQYRQRFINLMVLLLLASVSLI